MKVLAIDPGREKCGVAVVSVDIVHFQKVVGRKKFSSEIKELVRQYDIRHIVLGDGTGSQEFHEEIKASFPHCAVSIVDEHLTTEEARKKYWQKQKPRGWRRLIPTTMQVPPEPYDDYVAVILACRFLKKGNGLNP